jgi:hypothetical protein
MDRQLWQSFGSGELYLVDLRDGVVVACAGPLHQSDWTAGLSDAMTDTEDAAWMQEHADEFGLRPGVL